MLTKIRTITIAAAILSTTPFVANAAVNYNAVNYNAVNYNAVNYNAVNYNAYWYNGVSLNGIGRNSVSLNGVKPTKLPLAPANIGELLKALAKQPLVPTTSQDSSDKSGR